MNTSARRTRLALAVGAPLSVLVLSGCGAAEGAIDRAQQAVGGAQAVLDAPQQIAEACKTAVTALAPGESATDAARAMGDAALQLDEALGAAAAIPGVSAVREAFAGAVESLTTQTSEAASLASREAVTTACAVFTSP